MKLNHMKAFHELMLTGSVSESARNLHRSQPAISALIAGLEDDLGMKLFERRNGRLHPVPEAFYLHEECLELLGRIDTIKQNMRGIRALKSGKIEIVSMPGPSVFLLPNLISDFISSGKEIESTLISRSSDLVFQLLAAQQFDLGIADYIAGKASETSLVNADTYRFNCLVAMPHDDALADKEYITPEDLAGEPLATLHPKHEIYLNIERTFSEMGKRMHILHNTQYFIPLLTYAEKRIAYAIVDPIAVESYRLYKGEAATLVFKPFRPEVNYRVSILTPNHRPASLLTQSFTSLLTDEILRLGGIQIDPDL